MEKARQAAAPQSDMQDAPGRCLQKQTARHGAGIGQHQLGRIADAHL